MSLIVELVALLADFIHHIVHLLGDGDSVRGSWASSFRPPTGGECIEYYRLSEIGRGTLIFIQQYKRQDGGRFSRLCFRGQGIRHGDLLYAYYTSIDKTSDRAGVIVLRRIHEGRSLEKVVRAQYLETYPGDQGITTFSDEISLHALELRLNEKIKLNFSRFLFETFAEAEEALRRHSKSRAVP